MNTQTALFTYDAAKLGAVTAGINALYGGLGASIALIFRSEEPCGLSASFHGSTDEIRHFAAELIRHADAADAAITKATGERA
ncbi:hypothetical protein SAMN04487785_11424 [Dyella jiangningensis]|uniref:hypothetical protein n=1 Tax=Dyella sp. AtDHG13 TaxID=1938897 RepID=UPI00088CFDEF|nr:hypothetical protein [Dyella sp. AtDHG13]PXV54196.1 hypothetical protein BDW41_113149 [Dyella sp. AtDHG13]SDL04465.1 hypothetical protein SAMN04487785_11424 [Dyella jiangningensis]